MSKERIHPNVVVRHRSPNQSVRSPGGIQLLVIHTTEGHNIEGKADLEGLGGWFGNPAAEVSAHVCTDADGNSGRYVADTAKAWHVGYFNSISLGCEQMGSASEGFTEWRKREKQLDETARWLARWSYKYGVPLRKGHVSGKTVVRTGVVEHAWLGADGGGHVDPGAYPVMYVIRRARIFKHQLVKAASK